MALAVCLVGRCRGLSTSPDGARREPPETPPLARANGISVQQVGCDQCLRWVLTGMHVDRHQPGGQVCVLAIELDAVVRAEVQSAIPATHDHAVGGSHLLDTLQHSDLVLEAHVLCEQGASPLRVEAAGLIERGDVVVDERRHPLSLEEFSKLPLIRLLAHGVPLEGS
jgi:hypothetical protein